MNPNGDQTVTPILSSYQFWTMLYQSIGAVGAPVPYGIVLELAAKLMNRYLTAEDQLNVNATLEQGIKSGVLQHNGGYFWLCTPAAKSEWKSQQKREAKRRKERREARRNRAGIPFKAPPAMRKALVSLDSSDSEEEED